MATSDRSPALIAGLREWFGYFVSGNSSDRWQTVSVASIGGARSSLIVSDITMKCRESETVNSRTVGGALRCWNTLHG